MGTDCRGNLYVLDQASTVQKFGEPGTAALPCPVPVTTTTGTPPAAKDVVPPSFSKVSVAPRIFSVDRAGATRNRRTPKGTTIRYTLSEAATVRFEVQRRTVGRRAGKKCVPRSHRNAGRRKCKRYRKLGAFSHRGVAGQNARPFAGKVGHRFLRPGFYRLALRASDEAGNRSRPVRRTFKIVP